MENYDVTARAFPQALTNRRLDHALKIHRYTKHLETECKIELARLHL